MNGDKTKFDSCIDEETDQMYLSGIPRRSHRDRHYLELLREMLSWNVQLYRVSIQNCLMR